MLGLIAPILAHSTWHDKTLLILSLASDASSSFYDTITARNRIVIMSRAGPTRGQYPSPIATNIPTSGTGHSSLRMPPPSVTDGYLPRGGGIAASPTQSNTPSSAAQRYTPHGVANSHQQPGLSSPPSHGPPASYPPGSTSSHGAPPIQSPTPHHYYTQQHPPPPTHSSAIAPDQYPPPPRPNAHYQQPAPQQHIGQQSQQQRTSTTQNQALPQQSNDESQRSYSIDDTSIPTLAELQSRSPTHTSISRASTHRSSRDWQSHHSAHSRDRGRNYSPQSAAPNPQHQTPRDRYPPRSFTPTNPSRPPPPPQLQRKSSSQPPDSSSKNDNNSTSKYVDPYNLPQSHGQSPPQSQSRPQASQQQQQSQSQSQNQNESQPRRPDPRREREQNNRTPSPLRHVKSGQWKKAGSAAVGHEGVTDSVELVMESVMKAATAL